MLALDATFHIVGGEGKRIVAANDFFLGTYLTDLSAGEILARIEISKQAGVRQ